mmetsp:Transcript_9825/g.17068  ORF Transcript_9825/g.17068 Transcript_9825/m.17068 type:complete len:238 (+) Transcript_9825:396-1109(+)
MCKNTDCRKKCAKRKWRHLKKTQMRELILVQVMPIRMPSLQRNTTFRKVSIFGEKRKNPFRSKHANDPLVSMKIDTQRKASTRRRKRKTSLTRSTNTRRTRSTSTTRTTEDMVIERTDRQSVPKIDLMMIGEETTQEIRPTTERIVPVRVLWLQLLQRWVGTPPLQPLPLRSRPVLRLLGAETGILWYLRRLVQALATTTQAVAARSEANDPTRETAVGKVGVVVLLPAAVGLVVII